MWLATLLLGFTTAACGGSDDGDSDPTGDFAVIVGCSQLLVPQGDLFECPITVSYTGGENESATLNSLELLRGNDEVMTDFNYGQGISMYTDPIPDNLEGSVVGPGAPLSADLRLFADTETPLGPYPAGIRVTYTLGGSTRTETVNFTFSVVAN
jgi:hypothetical protein